MGSKIKKTAVALVILLFLSKLLKGMKCPLFWTLIPVIIIFAFLNPTYPITSFLFAAIYILAYLTLAFLFFHLEFLNDEKVITWMGYNLYIDIRQKEKTAWLFFLPPICIVTFPLFIALWLAEQNEDNARKAREKQIKFHDIFGE